MRRMITLLVTFMATCFAALLPEIPRTPVVVKFSQHQFVKRGHAKAVAGGFGAKDLFAALVQGFYRFCRFVQAVADFPLRMSGFRLLTSGHLVLPAEAQAKYNDYVKLTTELHQLQEKYKGKPMPEDVGKAFDEKFAEAKAIWEGEGEEKGIKEAVEKAEAMVERGDWLDEAKRRQSRISRLVPDPTMPQDDPEEQKGGIAGFITLGDYVIAHQVFQKLADSGFREAAAIANVPVSLVDPVHHGRGVKGRDGRPIPLIALTRQQRKAVEDAFREAYEIKATPTIGAGVIEPERLDIIPQVTADDRLRLRDVIQVGRVSTNAASYIREESFTRAAAETAAGSAKPEATVQYTEQTANVRTIPVWMPVTTEQLADWPQLRSRIDGRLLYDIRKREEEQLMYGSGTGQNLEGILVVSGTQDVTAHAKYTAANDALEHIRLGVTLVMVAGYEANALLIHPLDWFDIVVLKGSDKHYLGQVFMVQDRAPRVWGIDVVETIAAEQNAGNPTEERNWVVGDFVRGCELLDRMQATVMVGLNSDDFTKNRRTILAEERVAFPIYAPKAFAYKETQALAT